MIRIGLVLSLIGAALLLAGPLGTRAGLWSFIIGFLMLGLSLLLALVGASLSLVGGIRTGQWAMAGAGIIVGLAVVSVPSAIVVSARGAPPIHDITTDPDHPPAFVAILPLRAGAANPPEYAGGDVAAQQRRAYPDIQPLVLQADSRRGLRPRACRWSASLAGKSWPAIARPVASKPTIRRSGSASRTMW